MARGTRGFQLSRTRCVFVSALVAAVLLQSAAGSPALAAPKKVGRTAAKSAAAPRPTPGELEDRRHVRQMAKLSRERVEAERSPDRKAASKIAKLVQLELKRHEARRAAIAKRSVGPRPTKSPAPPRKVH